VGWIRSDKGASLIEWAILVVMIAVVALIAVSYVGAQNSQMWSDIASSLP
jgi:Flp pilus assembly pilin Flp